MKPVFADTSYYVALLGPRDAWHARAMEFSEKHLGRIAVTEYVLVETGNMFCKGPDRAVYLTLLRDLEIDPLTRIIPASQSLFRQGVELFAARPDKDWSLVDCISFVVMKQHRLTDALTTDDHFKQAGFNRLLT
jgi:predicted nucleic acid-binding protein